MRQYPEGVPIRVRVQGDGSPVAFVWAGETHRIETIEAVREPRLDWWAAGGEVHRLYYLVVTHRGVVCEIYRDVAADEWFVGRRLD